MSIVQTAYYIGVIASGFLAGRIADIWGWQYAFIVFGAVGVIHALIMMVRLKDKRDVAAERTTKKQSNLIRDLIDGFTIIFRTPTAATVTIGFAGLIFVLTGYLTWMPTYLQEAPFNMSSAAAGWHSMFYTHFAAFFGVLLAGKLSDYVGAMGKPALRTAMQGIGLLVAAPCIYYMGHSSSVVIVFGALALFGFARAFFDANTYVVLYDVVPAKFHSSASGVMIMIGFGTGALAPYLLGLIKEASGLSLGFTILAAIWVVCGVLMIVGGKLFYKRDLLKLQEYEK
jgi:sugar phosphate permease